MKNLEKWSSPTVILRMVAMGTLSLIAIVGSLISINNSFTKIHDTAVANEGRYYAIETVVKGIESEIDILNSTTMVLVEQSASTTERLRDITAELAAVHVMAQQNQRLIEANYNR